MNYLTNYYKNLCENLQEKINVLTFQLNEGRYNPDTGEIDLVRGDMWHPSDEEFQEYHRKRNAEIEEAGGYENWAATRKKANQEKAKEAMKLYGNSKNNIFNPKPSKEKPDYVLPDFDNIKSEAQRRTQDNADIMDMRRTAEQMGGIPSSMVNEPLPGFNFKKNLAFPVFKEKQNSPNLKKYGDRTDAINILPQERNDTISSVNTESSPAFNNDLNLLRDKKLSDPRNRDEIDFSEIKKKLSRVAKNI